MIRHIQYCHLIAVCFQRADLLKWILGSCNPVVLLQMFLVSCVMLLVTVSSQGQSLLGIFVDDVGDTDSGNDFKEIRSNALEQASCTFILHGLLRNVPDAGVRRWMKNGSLSLKSGS